MNKKIKLGAVAVLCAVMLVSTAGLSSASKTIVTYREKVTEVQKAFNMTNNTKAQLVRVLALVGVNGLGLLLLWKLRGFKSLKILIAGVLIGFDAAVIPAIILNMQRQPQNETNSTLS